MDYMVEPLPDGGVLRARRRRDPNIARATCTHVVLYVDSKSEIEAEQDFGIKCDNCFHYQNFIQFNDNNEIIENGTYIHTCVFKQMNMCIDNAIKELCQKIDKLHFQLTIDIFTQRIIGKKEKNPL